MISLKIDVTKIPKGRIFIGQKGKYLDLRLVENKDGQDKYGNDGFVAIDVSKDAREAGEKGEIIGNWKEIGQKRQSPAVQQRAPVQTKRQAPDPDLDADDSSDVPF